MPDHPSWTTFLVVLILVVLVVAGCAVAYERKGPGRAATQPR